MDIQVDTPYSVLYANKGEIYNCGPFASESEAVDYIRGHSGEFDLDEQYVYILTPDHRLISITSDDLGSSPDVDTTEAPDDDDTNEDDGFFM